MLTKTHSYPTALGATWRYTSTRCSWLMKSKSEIFMVFEMQEVQYRDFYIDTLFHIQSPSNSRRGPKLSLLRTLKSICVDGKSQ